MRTPLDRELMIKLGVKIREYRLLNKMEQGDLGALLNVSAPTISRWENGSAMIPASVLFELDIICLNS